MGALEPELQSQPSAPPWQDDQPSIISPAKTASQPRGSLTWQLHSHPGDAQGQGQRCGTCSGTAEVAEAGPCRDNAPQGGKRKERQRERAAAHQKPGLYQHWEITHMLKAHHNMGNFSAEIGPKRTLYSFLLVSTAPNTTGTWKFEADSPPAVLYHFYWLEEYVLVKTQQKTAVGNVQPFLTNPIVQCSNKSYCSVQHEAARAVPSTPSSCSRSAATSYISANPVPCSEGIQRENSRTFC